jgi:ribosomal protein L29
MTLAAVLSMILALPISRHDRAPELREAKAQQLREVASAIAEAVETTERWPGSKRELAALLTAVGWHESAFAMRLGNGECKAYECDPHPVTRLPRSVSHWQIQVRAASSPEAWELAKTDVRIAAREAARLLAGFRRMCAKVKRPWFDSTISAYGSGRGCLATLPDLHARRNTFSRLLRVKAKGES